MIEVNANYFRAAAECQSVEETRYYLGGVYIAPHPEKGAMLTATDGHRLICLYDENGKCSAPKIVRVDPKAIDAKAISSMQKAMAGEDEEPKLFVDDDGIVTVGTYRSLKSCVIDGTYPDWPAVLRPVLARAKEGKFCPASYNQKYVTAFGKIAVILSPTNHTSASIRIISFTENDPSLIRFSAADHAFGVLMPMRSAIPNQLPLWMKPILEPVPPPAAAPALAAKPKTKAKKTATRRAVTKRKPARIVKKKPTKRRAA